MARTFVHRAIQDFRDYVYCAAGKLFVGGEEVATKAWVMAHIAGQSPSSSASPSQSPSASRSPSASVSPS